MADFYVNLSLVSGTGTGTEQSPLTLPQMIDRIKVGGTGANSDRYFAKGITHSSYDSFDWGEADPNRTFSIAPWTPDNLGDHYRADKINGPWIWKAKGILRSCSAWSGIIYTNQFDVCLYAAFNCYIAISGSHNLYLTAHQFDGDLDIQGCTVVLDDGNVDTTTYLSPWQGVTGMRIQDCVWIRRTPGQGRIIDNITVQARHNTFQHTDSSDLLPTGTFTDEGNNQFGWSPPVNVPFTPGGRGWGSYRRPEALQLFKFS